MVRAVGCSAKRESLAAPAPQLLCICAYMYMHISHQWTEMHWVGSGHWVHHLHHYMCTMCISVNNAFTFAINLLCTATKWNTWNCTRVINMLHWQPTEIILHCIYYRRFCTVNGLKYSGGYKYESTWMHGILGLQVSLHSSVNSTKMCWRRNKQLTCCSAYISLPM